MTARNHVDWSSKLPKFRFTLILDHRKDSNILLNLLEMNNLGWVSTFLASQSMKGSSVMFSDYQINTSTVHFLDREWLLVYHATILHALKYQSNWFSFESFSLLAYSPQEQFNYLKKCINMVEFLSIFHIVLFLSSGEACCTIVGVTLQTVRCKGTLTCYTDASDQARLVIKK